MPLAISFLLAALAIAEPLILCSKVVYAALPTLLKLRTIGELIVTLFAASGTAITNPVVVPAIYQAGNYSIEYLVEEDILNVEGHPEYTDEEVITSLGTGKAFNLDTTGFRNLMETNWQSMRDYQIDAVMRLNEIANTDSVYGAIDNIGGILQDVCKYGYCGYENTIAIVGNPLTSVKVGLENIKESVYRIFNKEMKYGYPSNLKMPSDITVNDNDVIAYSSYGAYNQGGKYYTLWYVLPSGSKIASYEATQYRNLVVGRNETSGNGVMYVQVGNNDETYYMRSISITNEGKTLNSYGGAGNFGVPNSSKPLYENETDAIAFVNTVDSNYNGNDIIGVNGNEMSNETGIKEGQGLDIIPIDDYMGFSESVNENIENGDNEENIIDYENLINNNEVVAPEEEPEPIIPVQPTDFPVRPTLTPEQTMQSMKGATPGITEFFPFCIPGDIVALFGSLNVEARQAPIITWNWEIERFGIDEEIIIDFSPYDTVASILRNLELILFIIGLAVATRNLIGA